MSAWEEACHYRSDHGCPFDTTGYHLTGRRVDVAGEQRPQRVFEDARQGLLAGGLVGGRD